MVRDDLQACLQAYQFAELVLAGAREKPDKEREQALEAAKRLYEEVQPRYEVASTAACYPAHQLEALRGARARLQEKLRC
jgi:hypothetical protein